MDEVNTINTLLKIWKKEEVEDLVTNRSKELSSVWNKLTLKESFLFKNIEYAR